MDAFQLETKLQQLTDELSTDNFIFDFLLAYGMPKSNISRLKKKSDVNSLVTDGELLVKNKKFFFKVVADIDTVTLDDLLETHKGMRIVMLTDYSKLYAYDSKTKMILEIEFDELSKNYDFFLPLAGVEKTLFYDEKEADVKASVKMAKLFDEVKKSNPTTNESEVRALNVFLTRLLFCFFAEDSNMFGASENLFTNYIDTVSKSDGSDLHKHIEILFDTLNSKDRDIASNLQDFPYVNGGLFKDAYPIPTFTSKSRKLLIECGSELDWSQINPDIFGSMIQAVITEEHRGGLGMHYTSVLNIMKVIEPLFLDELNEEYQQIVDEYEPQIEALVEEQKELKGNNPHEVKRSKSIKLSLGSLRSNFRKKLTALHDRLKNIKIFDPACGSGNFLIIAYKELRTLEMKILMAKKETTFESEIKLSSFYGIELDDFAHEVAILSLWLTEHQMNLEFSKIFGACNASLPLKGGGNIVHGNATRLDWNGVCPREDGDEIYILGNPPYLGSSRQNNIQKEDMKIVFNGLKNFKNLDYIACWFYIGAKYIQNRNAKLAFVTTNSISQGEQVLMLWSLIFPKNIEIFFAYESFKWTNNAKSNAGVTVIVVGLRNISNDKKYLFTNLLKREAKNINAYMKDSLNIFIKKRAKPISNLPIMASGNKPVDGGNLIISEHEKEDFLIEFPCASKYIKKFIGATEFINSTVRYCLWIEDNFLEDAKTYDFIKDRIEKTEIFRLGSKDKGAQQMALTSHQFRDFFFTKITSIIVPQTTSERREYIPIGFLDSSYIISNGARVIFEAESWIFGIITSKIHNLWVQTVAGRLETRIQYSNTLCYNTFPFPKITNNQKNEIEKLVNHILDARDEEFTKTLAQLYDPDKMPDKLREAHKNLDLYIEQCYRKKPFESDEERLAYLFKLYEKMIKEEDAK